ncbi:hypothetical protein BTO05_05245 [Winogradskyella sp. PC-19]|uniref:DUF3078 domain-containing protein n=1 Tax=unclassified Winogradskyella TaxID=2615021 RepID=UPI000B3D3268|nr:MULTISPECIES: DUF3078 domain-containing protein [unclassified Winogradskyella]ARV09069.1 hypothetical protein BTO05_05245 [Winogradskyella sp. PC-19]
MSVSKIFSFLFLGFISCNLWSQPSDLFINPVIDKTKDYGWKTNEDLGLYFNQVSFTNWNSGGVNSISAILNGKATANYKNAKLFWNSSLQLRYGLNKQQAQPIQKTEDAISIISNFGYEKSENSNWFYSTRFSFNTQFADGFNNPDEDPISRFMAPAYLFLGTGLEYGRHIEKLSFYASPVTLKTTFVLDQSLANSGAFGVNPAIFDMDGNLLESGESVRTEFGILLTNQFEDEIFENVKVNSLIRLYTDYLNRFGNIDIEWEINFDFKVNKYISAMFGSHLRYDDDIKTAVTQNEITNETIVIDGPKLQWKQLLGIGFVVNLNEVLQKQSTINK